MVVMYAVAVDRGGGLRWISGCNDARHVLATCSTTQFLTVNIRLFPMKDWTALKWKTIACVEYENSLQKSNRDESRSHKAECAMRQRRL